MLAAWGCHNRWFDLSGLKQSWGGLFSLIFGTALIAYCVNEYALRGIPYWSSSWHIVWSKAVIGTGFASMLFAF